MNATIIPGDLLLRPDPWPSPRLQGGWFHSEPDHVGVWALHRDGTLVPDRFLRVQYIPLTVQAGSAEPALWGEHVLSTGEQKAADYLLEGLTHNWHYWRSVDERRRTEAASAELHAAKGRRASGWPRIYEPGMGGPARPAFRPDFCAAAVHDVFKFRQCGRLAKSTATTSEGVTYGFCTQHTPKASP